MKKKIGIILAALILASCSNNVKKEEKVYKSDLEYMKIVIDAQSISNTINMLSYTGVESETKIEYDDFSPYQKKIKDLLVKLSEAETGFMQSYVPIDLNVTDTNIKEVDRICNKLLKITADIKKEAEKNKQNASPDQAEAVAIFELNNLACYYTSIPNPDSTPRLSNHPLMDSIEVVELQDIPFAEDMAIYDTSLWRMCELCPNIKVIQMFGADINDTDLEKLKLNDLKNLKVLVLAENSIAELPEYFTSMDKLRYLDLSTNYLTKLPDDLSNWKNLKYLKLTYNEFRKKEQQRIIDALPDTMIEF